MTRNPLDTINERVSTAIGNAIVAAGAVVTQNTVVESGSIYAGVPARKVKDIDASEFAGEIGRISNNYVMYSGWFKDEQEK